MGISDVMDSGDIWAAVAELQRQIRSLTSGRRLESASIGSGGIRVYGGGGVTVEDGGRIAAEYASGRPAALFGPLYYEATGLPSGHGLLVQADDDSQGRDVFRAKYEDSRRFVYIGETPGEDTTGAVDVFVSDALKQEHHSHGTDGFLIHGHHGGNVRLFASDGGLIRAQSSDNGDIEVLSDDRLWLYADGNLDGTTGGDITLLADGAAGLGGDGGTYLQPQSGSGTANVRMDTSTGQITYVSSTASVKTDIQDLTVDTAAVLAMRPRSWLPGQTVRQCPEWMHSQHGVGECRTGETVDPPEDAPREVGFVAEELDSIGLGDFVEYDAEGAPASIRYDRLAAALVPLAQAQQTQITDLTEQLTSLEARVAALEPAA